MVGRLYGTRRQPGWVRCCNQRNTLESLEGGRSFDGRSKEEVDDAFEKVFHYGKYSRLRFDHGANIFKEIEDSARGVIGELNTETVAVDVSTLKTLPMMTGACGRQKNHLCGGVA